MKVKIKSDLKFDRNSYKAEQIVDLEAKKAEVLVAKGFATKIASTKKAVKKARS